MKQIRLTIAPDGNTQLETEGFSGPECVEASRFLESALGRPTHEQKTAAYHQTGRSQHHQEHKES